MSAKAIVSWRVILLTIGLALLATGAGLLLLDVAPSNYFGIAVWLVLALVANDGVAALAVFGVSVSLRRFARSKGDSRHAFIIAAIVQGALLTAAIVTLVVAPAIFHQAIGTANPSVLPLDYGRNLLLFHAAMITLVLLAVSFATWRRAQMRRKVHHL